MTQTVSSPVSRQDVRWLYGLARSTRAWIGLSVGLGFSGGLLLIVQARLLALIIQGAAVDGMTREALWPWFPIIAGLVLVRAVLGWGREMAGFQASAAVRQQVRTQLVDQIHRLGPAHAATRETGALASVVMEQVEGLHGFFAHYLPQLALAVAIPAAILAFAFPISWAAGGTLLVTAPLIPLFMVLVGMGAENISQRHFTALSRMSAYFLNTLHGLPTLKVFDRSRDEAHRVAAVSEVYRRRTMSVLRIAFLSSAILEFFSAIAIAMVAVYLGMTYLGYFHFGSWGRPLTLSGGFFILLMAPEFYLPLRELGANYHARAEAAGAAGTIREILAAHSPAPAPSAETVKLTAPVSIEFKNVSVTYDQGRRPALKNVSFTIEPGKKQVIVGESGAGKTTLINAIMGFAPLTGGEIFVNRQPLSRLDMDCWHRQLAWIGQDPTLFFGTIGDNIRLGNPNASDRRIEDAAHKARVTEFASALPLGLDTPVGEGGGGLSRGQAQRVAVARAFLKDAPVLLLDEPTAHLDVTNARRVMDALGELSVGRTVVLLTHRSADVEKTDGVTVLSGGTVAETAPPAHGIFPGGENA